MAALHFETDADERVPLAFGGPSDLLVYFLSFAFATRYGAQHEFSKLALHLRATHKIDLRPLLTFADRRIEDAADRADLDGAWQDAGPLAETLGRVIEACRADAAAAGLLSDAPELLPRLEELRAMAAWAAARGARVRLSYEL
jgi:hypothetical protein